MDYRYIPVLRWKRGERVGLQRLSEAARQDVLPFIVLAPEQFNPRRATTSRGAMTADEAFIQEVITNWGTAQFYLDASAIGNDSRGRARITAIAARARQAGVEMIPATRLDAPEPYQDAVEAIVKMDGRGVALRVDLQEFTNTSVWTRTRLFPLAETDLMADFAENVSNIAALGASIEHAFTSLHRSTSWRTVTVIGTSMPENFTGFAAGLHTIRRDEWRLWRRLSQAIDAYRIHYGDYATVSPNAPPPGIAWGFPINVRYTLNSDFLICRGVKTTGPGGVDMDIQLIQHAESINGYARRNPLMNCWGDEKIDRIAGREEGPGNLEKWVQIGVNRHIELTRSRLP